MPDINLVNAPSSERQDIEKITENAKQKPPSYPTTFQRRCHFKHPSEAIQDVSSPFSKPPSSYVWKKLHHIQRVHFDQHEKKAHPSCVEIYFDQATWVDLIVFRNYYTAQISIEALVCITQVESKWMYILKHFPLMPYPHYENKAQDTITLFISELARQFVLNNPDKKSPGQGIEDKRWLALRFHLIQPSPLWRKVMIEDIQCYKKEDIKVTSQSQQVPQYSIMDLVESATTSEETQLEKDTMAKWQYEVYTPYVSKLGSLSKQIKSTMERIRAIQNHDGMI